jgi:hypothetical protein
MSIQTRAVAILAKPADEWRTIVVYSMMPIWIAGILNIVHALDVLVLIAALYAVYLFYLGLTPVMGTPSDKLMPYMVVSAVVIIVISIALSAILTAIFGITAYRTF